MRDIQVCKLKVFFAIKVMEIMVNNLEIGEDE